jgi:hypothetical protein
MVGIRGSGRATPLTLRAPPLLDEIVREDIASAVDLASVEGASPGDLTLHVERVPPFVTGPWAICDGCGGAVGAGDGDCVTVALSGVTTLRFHVWCFDHYVAGLNRFMGFMRRRFGGEPIH